MYIEEISNEIAKEDSGFGLAKMMYEQFKKKAMYLGKILKII